MTIGRFDLKLNTWTFIEYFNYKYTNARGINLPEREFPFVTLVLRFPSVTFPVQRRNDWGELERLFAISAPTLIQISNCSDISWTVHLTMLGFGISFIYQYGY